MRIVFWGTPAFAVPSLRALDDEGFDVVGVVTRPDRPAGRGRRSKPAPVKDVALDMGVPLLTPDRPVGDDFLAALAALRPDVSVVVAYGHILKREVLDVPGQGSLNVHASLLPALRGAAPVAWAIARGHERTGVTVMRMVEEMDAGPILHQVAEPILEDETASELSLRLSELGAEALVEALTLLADGRIVELDQPHDLATYAPKVDRATARIDWTRGARDVAWHVRGMDAVPGAWSELDGAPVKLFRPEVVRRDDHAVAGEPGLVLTADEERGLTVAAGEGVIRVRETQPPGARRMSAREWIRGRGVAPGRRFQ